MDKGFEKKLLILMIIATIFLCFAEALVANGEIENQYPGIMRFHVIANSDSSKDQELKLQVRDYVLEKLQRNLAIEVSNAKGKEVVPSHEEKIIREYIEENLLLIESWAAEAIKNEGFSYTCTASVGIRHIPAKYYDEIFFPEGNYEALTLTIGKGRGQNWWCVVFPPLCLIDGEDSPYKEQFEIGEEDKLILKSKVKEMMDENNVAEDNIILKSIKGIYTYLGIDAFFINASMNFM